jgi:hypothetical protein
MSEGFGTRSESKQTIVKVSKLRSAVDAERVQAQWLYQFQSFKDPRKPKDIEHNFLFLALRDSPPNNIPIKFLNALRISDLIGALFERTSLTLPP